MDKIDLPAETLDGVDIVYAVTLNLVVTAGIYAGVPDRGCLIGLIDERGLLADDISSYEILEVRIDDKSVAHAE